MGFEELRAVAMVAAALTPPAVAMFRHLGHGLRLTERFLLALALAPFVLALPTLGFALLVRLLPVGWCLWPVEFVWAVVALWPRRPRPAGADPAEPLPERGHGFPAIAGVATAIGAAVLVGAVALSVPFVRMWSDAWFHAGATIEIAIRGVPPQDPNFAGVPLYYPWFYHFLLALLGAATGASPFHQMALVNVWAAVVVVLAAAQLTYRAFGRAAAMWVGVIAVLGLDPFGWAYLLVRATMGETTGLPQAMQMLGTGIGALVELSYRFPPWHVSLLNRFWTGTALTPAIALGVATAWSVARALERPSRPAWMRTLALALATFAFHPAYAAIAVAFLGAGIVWAALGERRRGVAISLLGALAIAFALAIPYVRACSVPETTTGVKLGLYHRNLWSLLLSIGPWWLVAAPAWWVALNAGGETGGGTARRFCAASALLAVAGSAVIVLPDFNSDKLFYLAWVSLVPLVAAGWVWWCDRLRLPTVARLALAAALIVPTAALYTYGTAIDPRSPSVLIRGPASDPGRPLETIDEEEGYQYLRERLPDEVVVIEKPRPTVNEPVAVLAERRVFCGSLDIYLSNHFDDGRATSRPMVALMEEFRVRRGIQAALFDTGVLDEQQGQYLAGFSAPLYLLLRRSELPDAVWNGFMARPEWNEEFANGEMRIYRLKVRRGFEPVR